MASKKKSSQKKELAYIKIEFEEILKGKKYLLTSEANFLKFKKSYMNYFALRKIELRKKAKLKRDVKELKKYLTDLILLLPNPQIPKFIKENQDEDEIIVSKKSDISNNFIARRKTTKIEQELEDIQKKLIELESN